MPNPESGLYKKYRVVKLDEQGAEVGEVEDFTFTLIPEKDPAALRALVTYAINTDEPLRTQLFEKVTEIEEADVAIEADFDDDDEDYCESLYEDGDFEAYAEECE